MYILSFDVASKSLAVSIIKFNEDWRTDLNNIALNFNKLCTIHKTDTPSGIKLCQIALDCIDKIYNLLNNLIQPIYVDVVDLIPGKKLKETDLILRSNRLKGYLSNIDNITRNFNKFHVLVEYQMGPNNKSNNVFSQILYHYGSIDIKFTNTNSVNNPINTGQTPSINQITIEIVGPSLKNKLNLDKDKPRSYFIEKYAKTYDANKKHSIANMNYFLKTNKLEHMLANIKNKNLDDIADSITMTLAWLYLKSNLI